MLALLLSTCALGGAAAAAPALTGALLDAQYPRVSAAALRAEWRSSEAPQVPFKNVSAAYVARALADPVDWRTKGAVTPVKNQGVHGFCGTFGRVGSAEGQWALRSGKGLTSFSEQMLVDCIGWDQCVRSSRGRACTNRRANAADHARARGITPTR